MKPDVINLRNLNSTQGDFQTQTFKHSIILKMVRQNLPKGETSSARPYNLRKTRRKWPGFFAIILALLMGHSQAGYSQCYAGWYRWVNSNNVAGCYPYWGGRPHNPNSCTAGYYCAKGRTVEVQCPAGYKCPTGTEGPTACQTGAWSVAQWGHCEWCGGNRACSATGQSDCSNGWYGGRGGSNDGRWTVCHRCPYGYYCNGSVGRQVTPRGKWTTGGYGNPQSCSAGNYCPSPAYNDQISCPTGTYSSANSNYCTAVSEGYYRNGGSQSMCANGQYSAPGVTGCTWCPAGYMCTRPTANPQRCGAGSYTPSTGYANCQTCPASKSCSLTAVGSVCSSGWYSENGMSQCVWCPAGYYCVNGNKYGCSNNHYSTGGASSCTITPAGYGKDTTKKSIGMLCGAGYYSNSGTSYICKVCPQDSYCPDTTAKITCGSQWYCPRGTTAQDRPCPAWFNCDSYTMCNDGYYMSTSKTCVQCPAGQICNLRFEADNTAVSDGYYSKLGQSTQFICPAGYSCTQTANPVACSSGWYSIEGDMSCHQCQRDWACPNKEIDQSDQIYCPNQRGMYNDVLGAVECKPAPAGQYIEYGSSYTGLTTCPTGTYSFGAARACHECPPGYICPSKDKPAMSRCLRGTYSLNFNQVTCNTCEAGFMCEGDTRIACPVFKYSHTGWGYCKYTDQGYYLANGDTTQQHSCPSGTYSIYASGDSTVGQSTCQTCPVGHRCYDAAMPPQACTPGTFQANTGRTSCDNCASGFYSLFGEIECHQSPGGYYLPSGSAARIPRYCHPGWWSNEGASSCTGLGQYYEYTPAGATQAYECEWGFLCQRWVMNWGMGSRIQWERGMSVKLWATKYDGVWRNHGGFYISHATNIIANGVDSDAETNGIQCPAGYYCPYGTMKKYICPGGHYCPVYSSVPTPCPNKYYYTGVGATASSTCVACPYMHECSSGARYPQPCTQGCNSAIMTTQTVIQCPNGSYAGNDSPTSTAQCNACWPGHYCPSQWITFHTFPIRCPKGTWSSSTSIWAASQCNTSPAGVVQPYSGWRTEETGLTCQPGHACAAGTTQFRPSPCPAGKYADATPFLDALSSCRTCPDGFVCAEGTNVLYNPMTKALAGTYAAGGVVTECPAGTYSKAVGASTDATCKPCPAGYFCPVGSTDYITNVCEAGYFCPEGSTTGQATACPSGTYSTATGLKSSSECVVCPVGYYCAPDAVTGVWQVTACPAGTYSARIMLTVEVDGTNSERGCLACPAGYYCPDTPTFQPIACSPGSYSAASATACSLCAENYYCDQPATADGDQVLIPNGFYYTGGAGLAERPYHNTATYSCPPGYWCAGNAKTACPAGTYQPVHGQGSAAACLQTPAGYYTQGTGNTNFFDTPCPAGMYCPAGTISAVGYALVDGQTNYPILCPGGTFRSYSGATRVQDCGECPAGYVCSEFTVTPLICAAGYYCPQGSESMQACPTGTFGSGTGLTKSSDCSDCFGGRFCMSIARTYVSGLCDAMYYCVQNSNTPVPQYKTVGQTTDFLGRVFPVGDECAAGGFCDTGSKFPKPCPAGLYNPSVRMVQASDCLTCPPGKYCDGAPAVYDRTDILDDMEPYVPDPQPTGDCYAGYYCTGGSYSPKQHTAQPGHWTVAGATQQEECLAGTYQPQIASSSCIPCPETFYCPNNAMSDPIPCPRGWYCPKGTVSITDAIACPVGTFGTHMYLYEESQCQACTSGKYCDSLHQIGVTGDCDSGHYCITGMSGPTPMGTSSTAGGQCPAHHWCGTGVGLGTPNYQGLWDPSIGQSSPATTQTVQGSYSHTVDPTSQYFSTPEMQFGPCAKGYYCTAGSSWPFAANQNCNVKEFCDGGEFQPSTCAAGTYQPNPVQDRCYQCPAGFYCPTSVSNDLTGYDCPKGHYCPAGTSFDTEFPCPAGTYNDHIGATSVDECVKSPPGYYIPTQAAILVDSTMLCTAGYYCEEGSSTPTQYSCTNGKYCPQGSPKPIPCTPGKRCTTNNLSAPNSDCPAGYYCVQGTGNANGSNCPAGYFCPVGTDRPIPCPAGTYQPNTRQTALTDCLACLAGYYCPNPAMTSSTTYSCSAGFYCPTGITGVIAGLTIGSRHNKEVVCEAGKFCTSGQSQGTPCNNQVQPNTGQTSCYNCPAGHYCGDSDNDGVLDDRVSIIKCTPQNEGRNYYCPGGGINVGKVDCPAGTYNYVDGSDSSVDCWECPPGFFCPTNAADKTEKVQPCPAGQYCFAGSSSGTICPVGFYCPEGANMPIPCPRGYYGDTQGESYPWCTGSCLPGYYCDMVEDLTTYYTSTYDENMFPCVNHHATSPTNHHCVSGSYQSDMFECEAGYYCPEGSVIMTACPIGTYNQLTRRVTVSDCLDCPEGKYCYSSALVTPTEDCLQGYYCPAGSDESTSIACPAGYYCPSGSADKTACPPGKYQQNEVQWTCSTCPIGWYCPESAMTNPYICEPGYFCDQAGLTQMTACPVGSWSHIQGLTAQSLCMMCPYGKYCTWQEGDTVPMTTSAQAQECDPLQQCYKTTGNTFSETDMNSAAYTCGNGDICMANTIVPDYCPPGKYTDPSASQPMASPQCLPCPQQYYCPDWGITDSQLTLSGPYVCPNGYLCLGGAIHYSNMDGSTIKLCPVGRYCPGSLIQAGETAENLCKVNYYNPMEGQTACTPCEAGWTCQSTELVWPDPCPTGHYCPQYDATNPEIIANGDNSQIPCPAGTYSFDEYLTQMSDCVPCPPGKYCLAGSSQFTGYCDEGYVCVIGADVPNPSNTFEFDGPGVYTDSRNGPCPIGHFCPYGSGFPRKCPSGTYQDEVGQPDCKDCDAHYYCPWAGLEAPYATCDPGFYCISGSIYAQPYDYASGRICAKGKYCVGGAEYACPLGTYSPVEGLAQCYTCPPGFYCNVADGTLEPLECPNGHYCPRGTGEPNQCPVGTYTQAYMEGLESIKQCANCTTGYYCDDGTFDRSKKCNAGFYCHSGAIAPDEQGRECPTGFYCLEGTKLPTACPDGLYSLPGAKTELNCTDCRAGYYCVRYITASAMVVCPLGFYCPDGSDAPIPCPKGTFNDREGAKSVDQCVGCPAGSACDVNGISDFRRKLCPPGYYCERGSFAPQACPPGTFRPNMGAKALGPTQYVVSKPGGGDATCFKCVGGYYCPLKATVVPELCPAGQYCLEGSSFFLKCPPGYYCSAGSAVPKPCPAGNYCLGGSDTYIKCPFGTYCPPKTPRPIPCPNGMYGSGNSKNFDIESSCRFCGRGLYSEEDPTQCMDCTPGYVCLGATTSAMPTQKETQNGYKCPKGHYCPLGSYRETPCPLGTYNKYEGSSLEQKCLPCKIDWYSDLPGQPGCKKCGPTAYSEGGAQTCTCIGANRDFLKGSGSCLCSIGFKPKNNQPNVDSTEDCEQIVTEVCTPDQEISLIGRCLDKSQQEAECKKQCPGSTGKMVAGTGLCQCDAITEVQEICSADCVDRMPKTKLNAKGELIIRTPILDKDTLQPKTDSNGQVLYEEGKVDPSSIPGYYGNFKCEVIDTTQTECNMRQMGMTEDGSFTYEFTPNVDLVQQSGVPDNAETTSAALRRNPSLRAKLLKTTAGQAEGRYLQGAVVENEKIPRLTNPAMCITQGDIVFFNVNALTLSYPQYLKDSTLNTNKLFDYASFLELDKLINQGVSVTTFSFVFQEVGKYVFENKGSGTITTITVISPDEECAGAQDGVGVGMVTKEQLHSFGVQAQPKSIQPDAVFISLSMLGILSFLFILLTIFIRAKKAMIRQQSNLFEQEPDIRDSAIYYDRLAEAHQKRFQTYCCGLLRLHRNKVESESSSSSGDEHKKNQYSVKYHDLEQLLGEFHKAQQTLSKQLIDREKLIKRTIDDQGNLQENTTQEDELNDEIKRFSQFVQENKHVLSENLKDKLDEILLSENMKEKFQAAEKDENIKHINNPVTKILAIALKGLAQRANQRANNFADKMKEDTKFLQQQAYEKEALKSYNLKGQWMADAEAKRQTPLTANEREDLELELRGKLSHLNEMAAEEQDHQNHILEDILARRDLKRQKLRKILESLGDRKVQEDQRYHDKLIEIQQKETEEKLTVDAEIKQLRKNEVREIHKRLQEHRRLDLAVNEKQLEDYKKMKGKGFDPESELVFSDMLADYGNNVKALDKQLLGKKAEQEEGLEERLANHRQKRLREIEQKRKDKESILNSETVKIASKLNKETKQIETLLDPIQDEEERMKIILKKSKVMNPLTDGVAGETPELSKEAREAETCLQKDAESREIKNILKQVDNQNEIKRRETEQQRTFIQNQIDSCQTEDQKRRLVKQLANFESNLVQDLAAQQNQQLRELKALVDARKATRMSMISLISKERTKSIISQFQVIANSNLRTDMVDDYARSLADRIRAGFGKEEAIQVAENFLDSKHQRESLKLMNRLFEARAEALRTFLLDLLACKHDQLRLVEEEFEPVKQFLRQKRVKNLISLDEFTAALERITNEEIEKQQDIEISHAESEREGKDQLEIIKLQADAEQMKLLKDRQTRERLLVFGQLVVTLEDGDQMKNYLKKSISEAERELTQFKLHQDKQKVFRMKELQEEQEQRRIDLADRQDRLVNVEEMLKKDEARHVERFRRQREELFARKLANQQRQMLKNMAQRDVDELLDQQKKDLASMDQVLQEEQARQMEHMRERMKNKTAIKAKDNVARSIKLAELQKQRQAEAEQAKIYEQAGRDLATSVAIERKKEQINRLVAKASLMQHPCQKQCYSRKIYFKRHIANQQKLNAFLGRGILVEWASSRGGDDAESAMTMLSLNTEDLQAQINDKDEKVSYASLLQHIHNAEQTYDQIRKI